MDEELLILYEQVKKETGFSDLALDILFAVYSVSRTEKETISE